MIGQILSEFRDRLPVVSNRVYSTKQNLKAIRSP